MSGKVRFWIGVALTLLVLVVVYLLYSGWRQSESRAGTNRIFRQAVMDAEEMVKVTSLEGVRTVTIKEERDGVGVFAIGHYRYRISFDVESLNTLQRGDTLHIEMPREEVSILEHEGIGFQVIDVWGTNFKTRLLGPKLTVAEENQLRDKAIKELRATLYREGVVAEAREHAKRLILDMLSFVPGVVVIEDRPKPAPLQSVDVQEPLLYH